MAVCKTMAGRFLFPGQCAGLFGTRVYLVHPVIGEAYESLDARLCAGFSAPGDEVLRIDYGHYDCDPAVALQAALLYLAELQVLSVIEGHNCRIVHEPENFRVMLRLYAGDDGKVVKPVTADAARHGDIPGSKNRAAKSSRIGRVLRRLFRRSDIGRAS